MEKKLNKTLKELKEGEIVLITFMDFFAEKSWLYDTNTKKGLKGNVVCKVVGYYTGKFWMNGNHFIVISMGIHDDIGKPLEPGVYYFKYLKLVFIPEVAIKEIKILKNKTTAKSLINNKGRKK